MIAAFVACACVIIIVSIVVVAFLVVRRCKQHKQVRLFFHIMCINYYTLCAHFAMHNPRLNRLVTGSMWPRLDVADRVTFRLCMTVHTCITVFTVMARTTCPSCVRRSPKSPNDSTFVRPAAAYSSCQEYSSTRTAVAVVGPTVWNALGDDLRDPDLSIASFGSPTEDASVSAVAYSVHRAH